MSPALDRCHCLLPQMAVEGIRTGVVVLWEHGWHLRVCLSLSIWMEVSQLNMMDGEFRQREGIGYLTSVSFSGQADPCSLCTCDQSEQTLAGSAPWGTGARPLTYLLHSASG